MLMQPLRANPARIETLVGASTPAPGGGWNARDNLAEMAVTDAVILDNFFPGTANTRLRRGSANHATGIGAAVETLMEYAAGPTSKLLAVAGGAVYDASAAGAVGAPELTGLANSRFQHVNFGTAGGDFIVMVNGADAPRNYDGTAWSTTPAITGPSDVTKLVGVNVFKRRLLFVEENTLSFWYLPINSIGGAAAEFDLSSLAQLGGKLMAIGTWTRDGGAGIDDYAIFVTSQGEVMIYAGSDPGDATNWALVGVFRVGAPVGRRCLVKLGADLVAITADGFVPLSRILGLGRSDATITLSDKISPAVGEAVRAHGTKFGWQPILYPRGMMGLFNVPVQENGTAHQYVVNTATGAWCRFTGMDTNCWSLFNDQLYFGTSGKVMNADTGEGDETTDNVFANIEGDALSAYTYFGAPGRLKRFSMVRPVLLAGGAVTAGLDLNVDFENRPPTSTSTFSGTAGAVWDAEDWDTAEWGLADQVVKDWQAVTGQGYAAAVRMRIATNAIEVKWQSTDWLYQPGGRVG